MTWSSNLNIYRVNRMAPFDLELKAKQRITDNFDIIEQLLMRNMVEIAEQIFFYVGLEWINDCVLVCRLWHHFLSTHLLKRWAENLVDHDKSLQDLAKAENWTKYLHREDDSLDEKDFWAFQKICRRIFDLREVWRCREPKLRRLFCDSFVLSLRFVEDHLYCGLNNGSLQLWDLNWAAKQREQEIHLKGVKCIDVSRRFIATGSYDCTAKILERDSWHILHVISLHSDSVWDLKIRFEDILVTASLDGSVAMFKLDKEEVEVRFLIQAHQDLVAAVDFDESIMITGYEDSKIGLWHIGTGEAVLQSLLSGHNGGVTGLELNGDTFASSSYDGTVRLWSAISGEQLHCFRVEPEHFVRCVCFRGSTLVCGDFGGHVTVWDLYVHEETKTIKVRSHRSFQSHKGHVVCVQCNARRIVSGSRDKTVLVQDFWAKMIDGVKRKKEIEEAKKKKTYSRFRH